MRHLGKLPTLAQRTQSWASWEGDDTVTALGALQKTGEAGPQNHLALV